MTDNSQLLKCGQLPLQLGQLQAIRKYTNDINRTWKWELDTHLANWRNNGTMTFWNSEGSKTSSISSNSLRNITWKQNRKQRCHSKYMIKLVFICFRANSRFKHKLMHITDSHCFILIFKKIRGNKLISLTSFGLWTLGQNLSRPDITWQKYKTKFYSRVELTQRIYLDISQLTSNCQAYENRPQNCHNV